MKKIAPKPYIPPVNIRQMLAFQASRPETFTASPFVNAFLEIFYATDADAQDIAEAMGLPYTACLSAFFVETGMKFREFHDYWLAVRLNKLMTSGTEFSSEGMAQKLGFGHRSALWQFYTSARYKRIAKELDLVEFPTPKRQVHHW